MEGLGRGRARGRRIIEVPEFDPDTGRAAVGRGARVFGRGIAEAVDGAPGPSPGVRIGRGAMLPSTFGGQYPEQPARRGVGRGIVLQPRAMAGLAPSHRLVLQPESNGHELGIVEGPKDIFEKDLDMLEKSGKGDLISMIHTYFSHDQDVQFILEKLWTSAVRNHRMAELFAMNVKLLTFHKRHGDTFKTSLFKKLQVSCTTLPNYEVVKDMTPREKTRLTDMCVFIGQLYFRFRPGLGCPDRYNVMSNAAADSLIYLALIGGIPQLSILVHQLNMNLKPLLAHAKQRMDRLCLEVHKALVAAENSGEERLWLLCVLDHLASGQKATELPHNLAQYYRHQLGTTAWEKVTVPSPIELLADLPANMTQEDFETFGVRPDLYNLYKSADE